MASVMPAIGSMQMKLRSCGRLPGVAASRGWCGGAEILAAAPSVLRMRRPDHDRSEVGTEHHVKPLRLPDDGHRGAPVRVALQIRKHVVEIVVVERGRSPIRRRARRTTRSRRSAPCSARAASASRAPTRRVQALRGESVSWKYGWNPIATGIGSALRFAIAVCTSSSPFSRR